MIYLTLEMNALSFSLRLKNDFFRLGDTWCAIEPRWPSSFYYHPRHHPPASVTIRPTIGSGLIGDGQKFTHQCRGTAALTSENPSIFSRNPIENRSGPIERGALANPNRFPIGCDRKRSKSWRQTVNGRGRDFNRFQSDFDRNPIGIPPVSIL